MQQLHWGAIAFIDSSPFLGQALLSKMQQPNALLVDGEKQKPAWGQKPQHFKISASWRPIQVHRAVSVFDVEINIRPRSEVPSSWALQKQDWGAKGKVLHKNTKAFRVQTPSVCFFNFTAYIITWFGLWPFRLLSLERESSHRFRLSNYQNPTGQDGNPSGHSSVLQRRLSFLPLLPHARGHSHDDPKGSTQSLQRALAHAPKRPLHPQRHTCPAEVRTSPWGDLTHCISWKAGCKISKERTGMRRWSRK